MLANVGFRSNGLRTFNLSAASHRPGMSGDPDMIREADEVSLVNVSKSRIRILKELEGNRHTVSELARILDLNKSTVHGYLQQLIADGFVRRHEDDGRLWVYYTLSEAGAKLVARDRLILTLDLSTISVFVGSVAIGLLAIGFTSGF